MPTTLFQSFVIALNTRVQRAKGAMIAIAISLGAALPAYAESVQVIEYYHRALDAYFITARSNEQTALNALPSTFSATGMRFTTSANSSTASGLVDICRFYGSLSNPYTNTHFYGVSATDCAALRSLALPGINDEGTEFAATPPNADGSCPASAPAPIFRSFRGAANGRTPNHRYSTNRSHYDAMIAAGWAPEGVSYCVNSATPATSLATSAFKRVVTPAQTPYASGCDGVVQNPGATLNLAAVVEPHIARSATNANFVLASWQQDRWSDGGARGVGSSVSTDGGRNWSAVTLPFSRCAGGNIGNGGDYERATDPWSAIASDGTAYQMALSFSGEDGTPTSISAMLVARSRDQGRTWDAPRTLIRDASAEFFNDKNMLVVDPRNPQNAYAVWGRIATDGSGPAWFSRTTNAGVSWEAARNIYDPGKTNQTFGNYLAVLNDGTLVNIFMEIRRANAGAIVGPKMRIIRSNDQGLTWSAPTDIADYLGISVVDPETKLGVRDGFGLPSVAVGANNTLHVAWQDARFNGGRHDGIVYLQSSDGGRTWSVPKQINARTDIPAFTPTIHVRSDGVIGIAYYDLRANTSSPAALETVLRLATSTDQTTWYESEIEAPFNLNTAPIARGYFLGDYFGLTSRSGAFEAFYTRTTGSVPNNRTEGVFASLPEGSLKRAFIAKSAVSPLPAHISLAFQARVSANVERMLAARRNRLNPRANE
jgi:hypothetical protein